MSVVTSQRSLRSMLQTAAALHQDFPDTPAQLLAQALSWAADLRSPDHSPQA